MNSYNNKAFTLIEILVTSVIMVIVMSGIVTYLNAMQQQSMRALAINNSRMISNQIHEIFTNSIRSSRAVEFVDNKKIIIEGADGNITTFDFNDIDSTISRNSSKINLTEFANMSTCISPSSRFIETLSGSRRVEINFETITAFSKNDTLRSGFHSTFYCRNDRSGE